MRAHAVILTQSYLPYRWYHPVYLDAPASVTRASLQTQLVGALAGILNTFLLRYSQPISDRKSRLLGGGEVSTDEEAGSSNRRTVVGLPASGWASRGDHE